MTRLPTELERQEISEKGIRMMMSGIASNSEPMREMLNFMCPNLETAITMCIMIASIADNDCKIKSYKHLAIDMFTLGYLTGQKLKEAEIMEERFK